jgi:hypothetical protein
MKALPESNLSQVIVVGLLIRVRSNVLERLSEHGQHVAHGCDVVGAESANLNVVR